MINRTAYSMLAALALLLATTTSQARWMNAAIGRFQTMDTFEGHGQEPRTLHRYAYAADNPVNNIDPSGHDFELGGLLVALSSLGTIGSFSPVADLPDRIFTAIEKCNRPIENSENDLIIGIANLRGHTFFRWPEGDGFASIGFQNPNGKNGEKPRPDHPESATACLRLVKTGKPLQYGVAAHKNSHDASDAELEDCLKSTPLKGDYNGLSNNCNDWTAAAEKAAGLAEIGVWYTPRRKP